MLTTLESLIDGLETHARLGKQIVHRAYLPGQPKDLAAPEPPLPEPLERALAAQGIEALFRHQVDGLDAARAGKDVLITTPTASGKSLVFQLPILEDILAGGTGHALYLFPLKALGQDQRTKLLELARAAGLEDDDSVCAIYDGDTSRGQREKIRARPPRVLISNPDMLHYGILGHADNWADFLGNLRYLVLDELHTYRGIFGTHFHHVLQRLLRLSRKFGGDPRIIASSATAQNATEFAEALSDRSFVSIERSGAPREGRHFLLLQPETSPYTTAMDLFAALIKRDLKTIAFTKARRITELMHSWMGKRYPKLRGRVANYRAGFLATERREIEHRLFTGQLDGVISTSALEMGIDVGGLDACILVGYPGSMMATWQRSGRVGREGRESITALVALPDALDQYLLKRPDEFLNRQCEQLVVRTTIPMIADPHLRCAAAELPLHRERDAHYIETHQPTVEDLISRFELAVDSSGSELHAVSAAPVRDISLRGGGATYTIESTVTGRAIGSVDANRVLRECHPGAMYLHAGRQYLISELDMVHRRARGEPANSDWFTAPLADKHTEILEVEEESTVGPLRAWRGRVRVTERVLGFERKKVIGQEKLGEESLELPPSVMETHALWFAAGREIEDTIRERGEDWMGALHATEHAAISLFPVLALCDRGDLGGISIPYHPQVQSGAVFIYDGHGGAAGVADIGFERLPELLARVADLLDGCDCEDGCPACIHSPKCGNGNRPLDKSGARELVALLLGEHTSELVQNAAEPPPLQLDAEVTPTGMEPSEHDVPERGIYRWQGGRAVLKAGDSRIGHRESLFDLDAPLPEEARSKERHAATVATPDGPPTESLAPPPQARPPAPLSEPSPPASSPKPRRPRIARRRRDRRDIPRAPIPRHIERTVLFDVETRRAAEEVGGWHNLHKLGVALAVTCSMEEGRFSVYLEDQVQGLIDELRAADLVVGFNIIGFDYPVLSGYTGEDFRRTLPSLDLFETVEETIGSRLGLAHLAEATFGSSKSADGLQSIEWYKQGRFDLIEDYCRRDVELLRDLYLFGRREGHVLCTTKEKKVVRIPVDWP